VITLYASRDCPDCRLAAERLEELVLAHDVVHADRTADREAHTLQDNGDTVRGHDAISSRLEELAEHMKQSRRYQSDVCHDYGDDVEPC